MKVLILAGGFGTRLTEETEVRPKPMLEIGGKPMIWHIMKLYSHYGFMEFVVLLGYKGYVIKEYFANLFLHQSTVTIDLATNDISVHDTTIEPWKITLLDTGLHTMTGGRVRRAKEFIGNETFLLTYGDGVADVDIPQTVAFHKSHGRAMTMVSVQPDGRFGACDIGEDDRVLQFTEKPRGDNAWINGGFFVCEPRVMDYIAGDETILEQEPMKTLAEEGELFALRHRGFWKCMDTLRDKLQLEKLWNGNNAGWKIWAE